jgi:hypothetical protein
MNCVKPWSGTVRLKSLKFIRKLLGEGKHSALIQTDHVPAVCHKRTGWRRSRLTRTRTHRRLGHLFPDSSNLSNQPNALPPRFPYLCMQYTPIKTHSGMPTYYGGPLRHGRSATVVTRQFRLPARYCFLSPVRSLVRDSSRSDSHPCSWDEQKQKQNCRHLRFACVLA